MKRIIIVLFAMFMVISGTYVEAQEVNETFVVGMECGYKPYNWTESEASETNVKIDGNQYCEGYDVQIARLIASKMGKELVIKKMAWEGLILSLQLGDIDGIIAGMSPTAERKEEIDFSDIYYLDETAFGVVVRKDSKYADAVGVNDFENALIAAQVGTFHPDLGDQLVGIKDNLAYNDFPMMTVALLADEIDGFVSDSGTGLSINASNDELIYLQLDGEDGFVVSEEMAGVAVGVAKGRDDLLSEINAAIAEISLAEQQLLMSNAVNADTASGGNFFTQVANIFQRNYKSFVSGTITTVLLSLTATILGFFIALFVALFRRNKIFNFFANIYITVFRGTPMMVQAMLFYYGISMLIPNFRWSNLLFGNIIAGIIVVSINTGAYMAETIRSSINAIDEGQFEAAFSLGYSDTQAMRHIILPQAIKNAIPALANELIVNVKDTSVLNMISVTELFFVSNGVAATTYQIFQTFTITSLIYLFLTTILTLLLNGVEALLNKEKSGFRSYPASVSDLNHL